MSATDLEALQQFFKMFNVQINHETYIEKWTLLKWKFNELENNKLHATTTKEKAYNLTISIKDLENLVGILSTKAFYHDLPYQLKSKEEELILYNRDLKQLHDQYKTLLYMLANHFE